ncbi:tetratricopeptide repeat protein [Aquimarina sp. 2304DJ70-9]|uniref:tetratricopeptide repeat protein n=1 Tax=Aquimarina penaris TaxID=3231044 RepID=UPI0034632433
MFGVLFCAKIQAQTKNITKDSLKVEELYLKAIEIVNANPVESRKIFKEALKTIDKNLSTSNSESSFFLLKKAFILERLAYFLRRENKYGIAFEYLQESLELKRKVGETYTLGYTYSQIAWLWIYQSEFEKTKINLDSAYALSKRYGNIKEAIRSLSRYGTLYLNLKEYTKAEDYHLQAVKLADSINNPKAIATTNANYADFLRRQKRYEENIPYLKRSMIMHEKNDNQIGLESGYYALGLTYRNLKKPHEAIKAFKQSIEMSKKQKNEAIIHMRYLGLSKTYKDIQDYENAYLSYQKFARLREKGKNEINYRKMADLESEYKYEQQLAIDSLRFAQEKREVALLTKAETSKKWLYLALLLITVVAALVIGFLVRRNYQNKARILTEKIEKERAQKELLGAEVKANEEETKRLIADNSMRLEFKQEVLDRLKNEIAPEASDKVKKAINSLTSEMEVQIKTEGKLSGLQSKIDEVNKGFDARLRELYPSLTKVDREMCALLRLNLSIKEIMTVRNTSLDSVKSTRYRIRKKLGLSSGEELEKFIQNIA